MNYITKIIIGAIFIVLLILNFTIVSKLRYYRMKLQVNEQELSDRNINKELTYQINFLQSLKSDGYRYNNIDLKFENQHIISLYDYMKNKTNILVLRISDMHCSECVISILTKINRQSTELKLKEHILILGSYRNPIELKSVRLLVPNLQISNIEGNIPPFPLEANDYPYCFILNQDMTVMHSFTPNKTVHDITNSYLQNISQRYFQTN